MVDPIPRSVKLWLWKATQVAYKRNRSMRVSTNFSKTASQVVLTAVPEATRCRLKFAPDGSIMFMPTARKVVSHLPADEMKARKLSRDLRSNTLSLALNCEGLKEGIYIIAPSKFNWFVMTPYIGKTAPLSLATVRLSKKSG